MKTNEIKYSKRIFAFLDILGFESVINESRTNPDLIGKIANMLKRSKQIALSSLNIKPKVLKVAPKKYTYRAFSDTSTICGPYDSHDDFSFTSIWIMFHQYLLWKEEQTFIRGAIVYGDIYVDEDVIFGPALIDAYNLEKSETKAMWPRVLIDESLLNKTTDAELRRDFFEFIRKDNDKLVYLDYLRDLFHLFTLSENKRIIGESTHDFGIPANLFKEHKEAILTQVHNTLKKKKQAKGKKILRKYVALSEYHNSAIDKLHQVIKELKNNYEIIFDFLEDLNTSYQAEKLGVKYEPKYSAEAHPEQADMLNIISAVMNRLIENPPPNILEAYGIVINRQPEVVELERAIRTLSHGIPQELSKLDNTLQESMIDINSFGAG